MDAKSLFVNKTDRGGIHFIRSVAASLAAFIVDYGIMVLLTEVAGLFYLLSAVCGFLAGTTFLYIISLRWVFSSRRFKDNRVEIILFFVFSGAGLALNAGLLSLFTEILGIHYLISRMIAGTSVFFLNFLARKTIIFAKAKSAAGADEN